MSDARTYRRDRRYVTHCRNGSCSEAVVGFWRWWVFRAQFWRFRKMRGFDVLRGR